MSHLSKFKKALEKKDKYNIGLSPVKDWISTGNAGLNNMISGDMRRGIGVGRVSCIASLQGCGKTFLAANAIREAQAKGYFCVYIDTEFATSDGFMENIGVSMDEDKFMAVNTAMIEDVTEFASDMFKNIDKEEKIFLVIDSLSNLQPERDLGKFDEGKTAQNMGARERQLKQLVTNLCTRTGERNMAVLFTSHEYVAGSDVYGNPILKPNIGEGTLYLPSTVIELSRRTLKEGREVKGIQVKGKALKSRFTMTGSTCAFDLPWDTGMDFYDGAMDVLEEAGTINRNGAWYSYVNQDTGEEKKFQRKNFEEHADYLMSLYAGDEEPEERDEVETHLDYLEEQDKGQPKEDDAS